MANEMLSTGMYVWHDPGMNGGSASYTVNFFRDEWVNRYKDDINTTTFNEFKFHSDRVHNSFNNPPVMNIYFDQLDFDESTRELKYNITLCGLQKTMKSPTYDITSTSYYWYYGYEICVGIGVFEKNADLNNMVYSSSQEVGTTASTTSYATGSYSAKINNSGDAVWLIYKPSDIRDWLDAQCSGTITLGSSRLCNGDYYLGILFYTTCGGIGGCGTGTRAYSITLDGETIKANPTLDGTIEISANTSFNSSLGNDRYYTLLSSDGPTCAISGFNYTEGNSTAPVMTRWQYKIACGGITDGDNNYKYINDSYSDDNNTQKIARSDTNNKGQYTTYYSAPSANKIEKDYHQYKNNYYRPVFVKFRVYMYIQGYEDTTKIYSDSVNVYLGLTQYKNTENSSVIKLAYTKDQLDTKTTPTYLYGNYIKIYAENCKFNGNKESSTTWQDDNGNTRTRLYQYENGDKEKTNSPMPTLIPKEWTCDDYDNIDDNNMKNLVSKGIAALNKYSNTTSSCQYASCYLQKFLQTDITNRIWVPSEEWSDTYRLKVQLRTPNTPEIEILTKENCNPRTVENLNCLQNIYYLDPYKSYKNTSNLCLTIGLPVALYATYNDESESGNKFPANLYHIFYKNNNRIYNGYDEYGQNDNSTDEEKEVYWQYPCQKDDTTDLTGDGITTSAINFKVKNSWTSKNEKFRLLNSESSDPSRTLYLYRCPRYLPNNDAQVYKPSGGQQVCNEEIPDISGYVPIDSKTGNSTTTFSYLFYLDYDGDWDNSEGQEEQDLPLFDDIPDDECNITVTSKVYVSFTNLQQRYNLGKFNYIKLEIVHSADQNKIPINGTAGEVIDYSTTIDYSSRDDEINRYDSSVDYIECIGNEEGQYGFGNYAGKKIKHLVLDVSKIISSNYLESNHYYKFRLTCGYVKNGETVLSPNNEGAGYYNDERAVNTNVFTSSKMFRFNVAPYVQILYPARDETTGKAYSSNPYPYTIFKVYNNEKLTDLGYRINEVKITYTDKNEEDSREIKWINETTDSNDKTTGYFPTMNLSTDKNWQSITYDNRVTNFTTQKQGDYEFPYEPIDYLGGEVTRGQIVVYRHNTMDNVQNGSNYPKFKVTCKNYFGWSDEEEDNSVIDYFYYNELNDATNNSSNKTKENGIAITDTQYILGNDVNDFLRCIQYLIPKGSSSTLVTGSWWNYNIVNLFYDFISTQNKIDNEDMSIVDKLIKSDKVDDIHNNYWLTTMMNDFLRELYHRIWALNPIRPNNLSYEISMDSNSNVVYGVVDKNLLLQSLHYIYGNYILFYCKENDGWYMISDEYSYDNNYNVTLTVDDDFKIIPINDDFFKNKDNLDNYCVKLKDNEFYSLGLQIISGNKNNLYTGYFIYIHIDSPSYIEGGEIDKNKYGNIIYGNNDYKDNKSKIKNNDYYIGNLVNNIVDYLTEMLS